MQCLVSLVAVVLAVVVAASLPTTASAASFGEDLAVVRGGREAAVGDVVAAAAPALDDDDEDARKRKRNETVAEEVLTAIVDGITGESPDAKFGSEIREQIVTLVEAVVKFGAAAATEIASENGGGSGGSSRTASDCTDDADDGKECATRATRRARAVDNVGEGRRRQVRRLLVRYLVLLKVFALGIILPGAVLLSLLQSWKAVTLSLMALLLAGVIGLRGLVATAAKGQTAEVIHTTAPGGHYWKRVSGPDAEPDRLAYGAYVPVS